MMCVGMVTAAAFVALAQAGPLSPTFTALGLHGHGYAGLDGHGYAGLGYAGLGGHAGLGYAGLDGHGFHAYAHDHDGHADAYHGYAPLAGQGYAGYAGLHGHADDHAYTGYGFHEHGHESYGETILTCTGSWKDGEGKVDNSIAINIKNTAAGFGGMSGYGGGFGAGLKATINIYSKTEDSTVYVALSERTSDACDAQGHFLGHGLAGLTGAGYGSGYGGLGGYGHVHPKPDGVIAQTHIHSDNMLAQFSIEHMANYHTLGELAGRGVIVCKHNDVVKTYDGHYKCKEAGISCCTLRYAKAESYLGSAGEHTHL